MSCRIASKTTLNCVSYFFSRSSSLRASSLCVASISLSLVKVLIIWMLTVIARSLLRTLESIATPFSVKA